MSVQLGGILKLLSTITPQLCTPPLPEQHHTAAAQQPIPPPCNYQHACPAHRTISGDIYRYVPVSPVSVARLVGMGRARPKSPRRAVPLPSMKTLLGFTSRCSSGGEQASSAASARHTCQQFAQAKHVTCARPKWLGCGRSICSAVHVTVVLHITCSYQPGPSMPSSTSHPDMQSHANLRPVRAVLAAAAACLAQGGPCPHAATAPACPLA
jgi:hypothetical protein